MVEKRFGNYNSCCRLCLSEKHGSLRSVFDDTSGCQTLVNKISTFVGIMIYADDKLSTMICFNCIKLINEWLKYREQCGTNQHKLSEWLNTWNNANKVSDMSFQIKDEPIDDPRDHAEVIMDDDEEEEEIEPLNHVVATVKAEAAEVNEDVEEMPPPLTPHSIPHMMGNDMDVDMSDDIELVDLEVTPDIHELRSNNRQCTICSKMFSTSGNRRKHEKTIHGLTDAKLMALENGQALEQDAPDDGSQHSIESQLRNTELELINNQSYTSQNNDDKEHAPHVETDREKIMFAAGLKLQQSNTTPQEVILDENGLTRIELSYIEKCRAMVSMFDTLVCACHNAPHKTIKRMFSHLRSLRIWFPIYTCYNCMITHTDRSTNMRHKGMCQRRPLQHLIRLAELRKNDDVKRRLYQNFKCVKCRFLFSFHEDYCAHVNSDHILGSPPFTCDCSKVFNSIDAFREHVHKSCFINYYCDICFVIMDNLDEFEKHCKEVHDVAEGFTVVQEDNYAPRRTVARSMSPQDNYQYMVPQYDGEYTPPEKKVLNPHAFATTNKSKPAGCPLCGKMYSNYHNMLRHYKTHDDTEKNIPCYECDAKFRLISELKQHRMEMHNDDTPADQSCLFTCPDCGDLYQSVAEWEDHKSTHQVQVCVECGKEFLFKSELEQHRSVHLNLKVYRDSKTQAYRSTIVSPSNVVLMCEVCDKTFPTKEELREHKVVEHDSMPQIKQENGVAMEEDVQEEEVDDKKDLSKKYTCTLCNKHYLGYGGLWDHNKKKHPGRQIAHDYPRQCKVCDKLLYTGGAWVIHKRMHDRLAQQEQQQPSTSQETPRMSRPSRSEDNDEAESYFTCKRCFKVFSSKYNLKNHMKCHGINTSPSRTQSKVSKQVWCDICHQACQGPAELAKHKQEEHENESMPELRNQIEEVEQKVPMYRCDLCDKGFPSKFSLKRHKEAHVSELHNTPLQERPKYVFCKHCRIPFINGEKLAEHMMNEHEEITKQKNKQPQQKKFPCSFCKKVFDTAGGLCSHQGWHKRGKADGQMRMQDKLYKKSTNNVPKAPQVIPVARFHCQRCPSEFSNDTALQIHILERHRNVNATIVPPRCTQCCVEFDSQEAYEKHKQLHMIIGKKKEPKQHPCQYCPAGFSRSDTLNAHIRMHHNEYFARHFKCHLCDRVFEKQNALTIHLKVHERQNLTGHGPSKPMPKGLSCSICQIVFQDPKELRKHVFSAHPF